MTGTKRTKNIAFRLTDTEYARIKRVASAKGDDPNPWCRNVALKQSSEVHMFTGDEQLIYEQIATLRFLEEHGIKSLAWTNEKLMYEWKMLRQQADENAGEIAEQLVTRRQRVSRKK
jgi:hypothetical protein